MCVYRLRKAKGQGDPDPLDEVSRQSTSSGDFAADRTAFLPHAWDLSLEGSYIGFFRGG
jgi:hypothetical protein